MPRPAAPTATGQLVPPPGSRERPLALLIDGYSLVFRSYFVLAAQGREMKAPDGFPTNALYAFTGMLLNCIEAMKPDHLAICLDAHGPTFRQDLYSEYKANRDEAPEDLKLQLDMLREYLTGVGLPWIEVPNYEADDLLGTLADQAVALGMDAAIVTGDKDALQLVSDHITVFTTLVGTSDMKRYDPAAVRERFGVDTAQFVDYKALLGDKSDNIPGVLGIGEKTAEKLLNEYPTIEAMLEHLEEIEPKGVRAKLEAGREMARLSKELSAIHREVPTDFTWSPATAYTFEPERFAGWFTRLGFNTKLKQYGLVRSAEVTAEVIAPIAASHGAQLVDLSGPVEIRLIKTMAELETLITQLKKAKRFAFDFETTSLNPRDAALVGIAIAYEVGGGAYIPVGHRAPDRDLLNNAGPQGPDENLPLAAVLDALRPLLSDPDIAKVVQNGKYESSICAQQGIVLEGLAFDTFVASYLLNPDDRHNLKDMAQTKLGVVWNRIEDLIGTGKKQITMDVVPVADAANYAVHDAVATWRLKELFAPQIESGGLGTLFHEVEMPLVPILARMEMRGIRVNPTVLRDLSEQLRKRIAELKAEAVEATGDKGAINLNSPKQLSELLFNELGLRNPKKGSTDIEVLTELQHEHPLIPIVMENRELAKLRGTYTEGLLPLIEKDGRIHTSYNQGVAATGRLSSNNPNLQNIPIRTELGRQIRRAFIPTNDQMTLLSADYSQIELRLLAHYTEDEALLDVFRSGGDIHTSTAVDVLGDDASNPDPEKRRQAKAINFGIIYGMGAFSLGQQLGIPQGQADLFIKNYFRRFPGVERYFKNLIETARTNGGWVETFLGRRRQFKALTEGSRGMQYEGARRAAMNMPLQGGASDLIKMAMVEVAPLIEAEGGFLLLQVHDELVFEVPIAKLSQLQEVVGATMAGAYEFKVPIGVDLKAGPSWYDLTFAGRVVRGPGTE